MPRQSKKSQENLRRKIEQEQLEKTEKFSATLLEWLQAFAQYYRQDGPNETAILLYKTGLEHLTLIDLNHGCQEAIRKCKFFPTVAEILQCLKEWRERQPTFGTSVHYEDQLPPSKEERDLFSKGAAIVGNKKLTKEQRAKAMNKWEQDWKAFISTERT